MRPSKVIIIGTGRLACACLESSLGRTRNVECVEPENPTFSTLKSLCTKRAVRYQCILEREALSTFFLGCASPTLVVSAYNSFIFPKAVLANPCLNIVNFHNSLLPRHRGRNAPTWTIFEMDALAGITWHQVMPEIDKGSIICQRDLMVSQDINAIHLTQQTLDLGAQVFHDILDSLLDGTYSSKPILHHKGETFHRSSDVPNDGILDLAWSLPKAHAFLRSLDYGKVKVFASAQIRLLGRRFSVLNYCANQESTVPTKGFTAEASVDQLLLRDGCMCLTIHLRKN